MHFRRLAALLLGAWLAGSLLMALVATENFRTVDRLLASPSPGAAREIAKLGHDPARSLLRYQAAEENRWLFQTWEVVELCLGLALLMVLVFGSLETVFSLVLALAMLLLVGVQRFYLTPEITALGRVIDFRTHSGSVEESRFWVMHGAYSGLEAVKWVMAFLLGGKLVLGTRKLLGRPRSQVNFVDKRDYRHIDR